MSKYQIRMNHSVALIGLGAIGMLYDLKLPESEYVLCHARAFSQHPDFKLIGSVEPEAMLRKKFSEIYKAPTFSNLLALVTRFSPDVVVVASTTNTHLTIIDELLRYCKPQLILCEKPLAYSADEAQAIVELCHLKEVELFVNYIRRADPGVIEVKSRLMSGQIASPFKAIVWYSKGLLHNGSHFLDLMNFWFGPVKETSLIDPGRNLGDQDAEPDFWMNFENCSTIFCSAKEENFSHYTIEVVASNGRLRYEQSGVINWQSVSKHPTLDHYRQLKASSEVIENDMSRYQYRIVEQLSKALKGLAHTLCAGEEGAIAVQWLEKLLKERAKNLGK